jgi:hypothetical protein
MSEPLETHALPPGTVLHGYRLIRVLGAGGFSITYLASEIATGRQVAIKEFLPAGIAARGADGVSVEVTAGADREDFDWGVKRYRREADTLIRLRHPSILSVERVFEANGTAYLVLEYEEGENLATILERENTLDEGRIRAMLDPMLSALEHMHAAGYLHRDIEPRNIVIRRDGAPLLVVSGAAPFGVGLPAENPIAALPSGYAAFEQYTVRGNQGPWTDLYAMGAVLYRAVAGERPPEVLDRIRIDRLAPAARVGAGRYSAALLDAIDAALVVSEEARPQSVREWRARLDGGVTEVSRNQAFGLRKMNLEVSRLESSGAAAALAGDMPAGLLMALASRRAALPASAARPAAFPAGPPARKSASARRWIAGAVIAAALIAAAGLIGLKALGVFGAIKFKLGADDTASSLADCTVYAPSTVARGEEILVQVFVHPPEAGEDADVAAQESDSGARRRGFASLSIDVPLGARIAFSLAAPGLEVEDGGRQEIVWRDRVASVQFLLRASAAAALGRASVTVRAAVDGVPAGTIRFMLEVTVAERTAPTAQGARARRFSNAYVCYASQDRAEVLKRVQMLQRVGIRYFQDVLALSPGERWEAALYRHIDSSDLFLLFWSSNAKASDWVRKEVLYALERQKREEGEPEIIPVLLEGPPPVPPPPELAHLHFNDPLLYFMADARGR